MILDLQNYSEIFTKLTTANVAALVISAIAIIILLINNELLKPKLSKFCILPVPIELIAVVMGTLVSKYMDLEQNYGIKTIGHIPTGFPGII